MNAAVVVWRPSGQMRRGELALKDEVYARIPLVRLHHQRAKLLRVQREILEHSVLMPLDRHAAHQHHGARRSHPRTCASSVSMCTFVPLLYQ